MIVVKLQGGMGNQMFQYALGRNLALKHETDLVLDLLFLNDRKARKDVIFRAYDLDIFKLTEKLKVVEMEEYREPKDKLGKLFFLIRQKFNPNYQKERHFHFDPEILKTRDGSYLSGHWTTEKYFKDIEKAIRTDFTFRDPLLPESEDLSGRIRNSQSVCLNVRRGDFVSNPITRKFHGLLGVDYFNKAIEVIASKVSSPEFFVFSDDLEWCRNNMKADFPVHFVGEEHKGEKFANYLHLMTLCKHFIIPNSTFGWWAAWLSENKAKIVVAPKKWFANASVDTSDVIPETWIKI